LYDRGRPTVLDYAAQAGSKVYDASPLLKEPAMQMLGTLGFAVMTFVNLAVLGLVLKSLFHRRV